MSTITPITKIIGKTPLTQMLIKYNGGDVAGLSTSPVSVSFPVILTLFTVCLCQYSTNRGQYA